MSKQIQHEIPSPLAGEGETRRRRREGEGVARRLREPPHLPIARAMGPFLSRKGRGEVCHD
jgi:hypothetical protein